LPVANKPDSQELCFAPSGEAGAYLETVAPHLMREGEVVDTDGRVLASHPGTAAFTVGQRRGLGVAGPEPSYVLEIDAAANRVVVGPGELLARAGVLADRVTWIAGGPPSDGPFEAEARLRYRGDACPRWSAVRGPSPVESGRRSAGSRPGRARPFTEATSSSAAGVSSTSSAEASPEPAKQPGVVGEPGYHRPMEVQPA
jgi:tRNA-specific 2-thiouridylase